jgi:hypothetical protein
MSAFGDKADIPDFQQTAGHMPPNGHAAAAMCFPRRQLLLLMTLADLGQLLKRYHPRGDLLDLLPWDIGVLVDVDGLLE